ncbi:MAG: type IV pilus assembly protein PilM [Phycisphaera sp.]|nr:type IV pilus assembly protein PilM [Phycisphaera sp.]
MPNANDSWGIEVGSNALKAIRLQRVGDDVAMVEYEVIQYPKVLSTPDTETQEIVRDALFQFNARHDLTKSTVVTSVAGNMAFARFAKLPPVEPKAVAGIVQYEAQQQIPFPIDQVEWDYQTFQFADSPDVEVGIFAITKDRVGQYLAGFHAAQLPVHKLSLSPVAVYNALSYDLEYDEDTPGTILMDIGTNSTDVIIVEQGRLWLRTIPIGGHHFTEALVSNFKLNYSKAEKIKREAATSKYARQIFQAMRPVFVDLVNEVQRSLGFYQTLNRDAELKNLIGMGSTFQLPGLKKFLKQQLSLEVTKLEKFSRIRPTSDASDFEENVVTLGPAYGLALQGLNIEKVSCNLLPMSLIRKQVWGAKKGYAAAAAAIIALSAGLGYSRLWIDQQSYESNTADRHDTDRILKVAEQYASQANQANIASDPRQKIENLRRTLDYRNVWPSILDDIATALASVKPQPELISQTGPDGKALDVKERIARIKAIPRNERRLVNIEQITYNYVPPADANAFGGSQEAVDFGAGYGMELGGEFGPGPMAPPPAPIPTPAAKPGKKGKAKPAENDEGAPPPKFDITISGTTPIELAPNFLNETFIAALKKIEADQESVKRDKPYKIKKVDLVQVVPVSSAAGFKAAIGGPAVTPGVGGPGASDYGSEFGGEEFIEGGPVPPTGGRVLPGAPSGRILPGTNPGGIGRNLPGGNSPKGATEAKIATKYTDYLPNDPLAKEDKTGDWRFTITWTVELLRPEDTRKAQLEAEKQKANTKTPTITPTAGTVPAVKPEGVR